MKERKAIKDPGAIQLLADETRMKMIYLLRAKEMTVSQIAAELGLTPQTIYHHIKRLKEADMVEVSREERVEHLVESYYRATAGMFFFTDGSCSEDLGNRERVQSALNTLSSLGFGIDPDEKQVSSVLKLAESIRHSRRNPEIVGKLFDLDSVDPSDVDALAEFAMMMKMNDREFEKYLETQRTLREWLLSRSGKA